MERRSPPSTLWNPLCSRCNATEALPIFDWTIFLVCRVLLWQQSVCYTVGTGYSWMYFADCRSMFSIMDGRGKLKPFGMSATINRFYSDGNMLPPASQCPSDPTPLLFSAHTGGHCFRLFLVLHPTLPSRQRELSFKSTTLLI